MKTLIAVLVMSTFVLVGNASDKSEGSRDSNVSQTNSSAIKVSSQLEMEKKRKEYLTKYCTYRQRIIFSFGITNTASADEIKRHLAPVFLGVPGNTPWEKLLEDKRVQKVCTEERRKDLALVFCGTEQAGWLEILKTVECMRMARK